MNQEEQEEIVKKKVEFFHSLKKFVHLQLKNGKFHNADIISIGADFFMINDLMMGELPIFFKEVLSIEPYTTKLKKTKEGEDAD